MSGPRTRLRAVVHFGASRLAIVGMAVVLLSIGGFVVWASRATSDAVTTSTGRSVLAQANEDARYALTSEDRYALLYALAPSADAKTRLIQATDQLHAAMDVVRAHGDDADDAVANRVEAENTVFLLAVRAMLDAADRGDKQQVLAIQTNEVDPRFVGIASEVGANADSEVADAQAADASLRHVQDVVLASTPPVIGAGLLLLALFAVVIVAHRRNIARQRAEDLHRASHDAVTGLPNRTLFRQHGDEALACARQQPSASGALMLLGVEGFKDVVNAVGEQQGDELARQIAVRLVEILEDTDTVARFGRDEFALLLPQVAGAVEANELAGGLARALERGFRVNGETLDIEVRIGVAAFADATAADIDDLLRRADIAMFASRSTHSRATLYTPALDINTPRSLSLVSELRHAIERRELVVHYQPKADLATARVVGVEALVRWQHPDRGLIPPMEFVPLAERTALIYPLTEYVLDTALQQCREWQRQGHELSVAVNISARNVLDEEFPAQVSALLNKHGVAPHLLELEITENSLIADRGRGRVCLTRLRDLGVSLSIDDFGTGYSSLADIQDFPVHSVKIDQTFVTDLVGNEANAVIVHSIVNLAANLGLSVVAEGVEDYESWRELAQMGCDIAQGYYLSRPMPGGDMIPWLSAWQQRGARAA